MVNTDGSVEIELGDNEAGSLTAINFEELVQAEGGENTFSLGIYLVPEGVALPVESEVAELPFQSTDAFIEEYGLTEIISFELGVTQENEDGSLNDTRVEPPEITSEYPIDIISVYFDDPGGGGTLFLAYPADSFSPFDHSL
ncbi:hypothetical protein OAI26_08435 [Sulfitobacter sp.]|nr:hypothetical protein [Sulfitobacter sp.]